MKCCYLKSEFLCEALSQDIPALCLGSVLFSVTVFVEILTELNSGKGYHVSWHSQPIGLL